MSIKRICIDPGHGKNARDYWMGANGNGIQEDVWVLAFAKRLGHYLRARDCEVFFTRAGEKDTPLVKRGVVAKVNHCNLFVSIHLNKAGVSSAHGVEAFYVTGDRPSIQLAGRLINTVTPLGITSRGAKPDTSAACGSLRVLRDTHRSMPAVLLEVGFLSNLHDAQKLIQDRWVENLACKMAATIDDFFASRKSARIARIAPSLTAGGPIPQYG